MTETDVSKLYRACVMVEQGSLVGFMLRNNPTLFSIRLTDPNGKDTFNAFEYIRFHKESQYLPQIWETFAEPNIKQDSI